MRVNTLTHSSVLILSTALSSVALGSGFALNEQSARTLGQAYAGRTSDADNASTLMSNPAGMSFLKRGELSAGFSFIDATSKISDATGTLNHAAVTGTNDGDIIPFTTIPFGYYVQPLNNHLAAGIGVYVPFGLATEYEDSFQGRFFGTISDVQVITIQPTVSYKFDNGLALGLGVTYNTFDGKLKKAISNSTGAGVKGDDSNWGYNVGALYEFDEHTRFGLTYYSKVKYTLEGHTTLSGLVNARYKASLDIETPDRIDFGFTRDLTPALTLHGDISRTNWKTLQELTVENEGGPTSVEPLAWDPSMFYSLALSYKIDSQWVIRGGIGYDNQPMPDATRSVRLPAGDRTLLSFGTTWSPMSNLDIDASFMYISEQTVRVHQTGTTALGSPIDYSAKFDNNVSLFSLQASWKF